MLIDWGRYSVLLAVISSFLVIKFSVNGTIPSHILKSYGFVFIGTISYSLYLWHYPIFAFYRVHSKSLTFTNSASFFLFLIVLFLSIGTYFFVERPFRGKSSTITLSKKIRIISTMFICGLVTLVGLHAHFTSGYPERFNLTPTQRNFIETAKGNPNKNCHATSKDSEVKSPCYWGVGSKSYYVVLGDSHGVELAHSLGKTIQDEGFSVIQLTRGCSPSYGKRPADKCTLWLESAVEFIKHNKSIRTVIVSFNINADLYGGHYDSYPRFVDHYNDKYRENLMRQYVELTNELSLYAKVIVAFQAPELPTFITRTIYGLEENAFIIQGVKREWWENRSSFFNNYLENFPQNIGFVDPAKLFCDEENCYAGKSGLSYYFDHNHMSLAGAKLVAEEALMIESCLFENIINRCR